MSLFYCFIWFIINETTNHKNDCIFQFVYLLCCKFNEKMYFSLLELSNWINVVISGGGNEGLNVVAMMQQRYQSISFKINLLNTLTRL